jgi:hypothetical protein
MLEHLYWGKSLNGDYDIRYLSESSRMAVRRNLFLQAILYFYRLYITAFSESILRVIYSLFNILQCFSTSEKFESRAVPSTEMDHLRQAETMEEILELWKANRSLTSHQVTNDLDMIQKRRIANLSWRKMGMGDVIAPPSSSVCQSPSRKNAGFYSTGTSEYIDLERTFSDEKLDKGGRFHTPESSPSTSRKFLSGNSPDSNITSSSQSNLGRSPRYFRAGRAFDSLDSKSLDNLTGKSEVVVTNSLNSPRKTKSWSSSVTVETQENEKVPSRRLSAIEVIDLA